MLTAELREKLPAWKQQLSPKHPMAEAVNYTLGQWTELNVFCTDGGAPIDNNVGEREMKRVVPSKKIRSSSVTCMVAARRPSWPA